MDDFYGPDVFFLSQWDVPKKQQRKPSFHTDSSNLHWSAFTCLQGLDASAWLLFNNTRGHSWICWIVRVAIPFSFTLVAFCCHTGPEPKRIEWSWNILKIYLLYFISGQTQSTQMPNSQSVQGSAPKKGTPSKSAIGFYCLQVEKVRNHSEKTVSGSLKPYLLRGIGRNDDGRGQGVDFFLGSPSTKSTNQMRLGVVVIQYVDQFLYEYFVFCLAVLFVKQQILNL